MQYFSVALDESTDMSHTAQLVVFLSGIDDNFAICEELACLQSMKTTATGNDIAKETIQAISSLKLHWNRLSRITIYGAPSMTGILLGAATLIVKHTHEQPRATRYNKDIMQYHCIIHQKMLCPKHLGFNEVMENIVKDVNQSACVEPQAV